MGSGVVSFEPTVYGVYVFGRIEAGRKEINGKELCSRTS